MDKGEDVYGHTDGFFQPVDDNTILLTATQDNMAPIMIPYFQAYRDILEKYYHVEQLTFNHYRCINDWAYINFVQLEDKILMPAIEGTNENDEAAKQLSRLYHKTIIPINMPTSLLNDGGALHCTTWSEYI